MENYDLKSTFIKNKFHENKIKTSGIIHFQDGLDELEEFRALYLMTLFQRKNLFHNCNEIHDINDIKHQLNALSKYELHLESIRELLVRRGYIRKIQEGLYESTQKYQTTSTAQLQDFFDNIKLKYSNITASANFLNKVMSAYLNIICSNEDFLSVMFPSGSFNTIEEIYKINPDAAYFNKLVAHTVKYYTEYHLNVFRQPVSIIEIGAGIGSTTDHVLPFLEKNKACINFTYTDISNAFIKYAQNKFKTTYPPMSFKLLNFDVIPDKQGFTEKYDIIIATNALHAAKNILKTLGHIKTLIKPNGVLIFNEGILKKDFSTLAYGLIDGWWSFEDSEWRIPGSPFISFPHWKELLNLAGFQQAESVTQFIKPDIRIYQDVIIGFSD